MTHAKKPQKFAGKQERNQMCNFSYDYYAKGSNGKSGQYARTGG